MGGSSRNSEVVYLNHIKNKKMLEMVEGPCFMHGPKYTTVYLNGKSVGRIEPLGHGHGMRFKADIADAEEYEFFTDAYVELLAAKKIPVPIMR